jgi:hypothetical protein
LRGASDGFVSVFDYGPPERITPALYIQMLKDSRPTSLEIMVHPSRPSARLAAIHPHLYDTAVAEGETLSDRQTAVALIETGASLATFRDVFLPDRAFG